MWERHLRRSNDGGLVRFIDEHVRGVGRLGC